MKRIVLIFAVCMFLIPGCRPSVQEYPQVIRVNGGQFHVQGIAFDKESRCLYSSFTDTFLKSDLEGNLIGSITGINGHLGAMTYDSRNRKVYASLELKDDNIGKNISHALGAEAFSREQSRFYVAEIDVDKVTGPDTPLDEAVTLHEITEAGKDYLAKVNIDGKELDHRYGCSGIDGVAIAPEFGKARNRNRYLYVAYGVYGDTTRIDNDYNILLCYDLKNLKTPVKKYFVHTGNTTYGVQNMTYDEFTERLYLAVYKGKKAENPNYTLFALDINQQPFTDILTGVPYHEGKTDQLSTCGGWHFKWGSTGINSLGDGYYYISENGKENGIQYCNATLYMASDSIETPFTRPENE